MEAFSILALLSAIVAFVIIIIAALFGAESMLRIPMCLICIAIVFLVFIPEKGSECFVETIEPPRLTINTKKHTRDDDVTINSVKPSIKHDPSSHKENPKIRIVTISADSWCPYCQKARQIREKISKALAEKGIEYIYLGDSEMSKKDFQELAQEGGGKGFPHHVLVDSEKGQIGAFSGFFSVPEFMHKTGDALESINKNPVSQRK